MAKIENLSGLDFFDSLIDRLKLDLEVIGEVPKSGPLLLIADHNSVLDVPVLIAATKRKDLRVWALSSLPFLGEEYKNYLVPIFDKASRYPRIKRLLINIFIGDIGSNFSGNYRQKNKEEVLLSSEYINRGNAIGIFPGGNVGSNINESQKWKLGVAKLLKQVENPNTKIVFARISGLDETDAIRLQRFSFMQRIFKRKKVKVELSESVGINQIDIAQKSLLDLVTELEEQFQNSFS